MILCRPVYQRASLTAFSFASAPPFVKKDIWRSPGVISANNRACLGGHRRADRAELVRLLLDRRHDLRMLVADRNVHELRREVEVPLPVVVPKVAALAAGHRNRIDRVLHRPGMEDVLLGVGYDLPTELGVRLEDRHDLSL